MNIIDIDFTKPPEIKLKKKLTKKEKTFFCKLGKEVIYEHSYIIDIEGGKVTCRACEKEFSPMFVLQDLCRNEGVWAQNYIRYKNIIIEAAQKTKVKCEHCNKFTTIKTKA